MLFTIVCLELLETTNPGEENDLKVDGENVLGVLTINLPTDAIGIRCLAPHMHSEEIITVEKSFKTKCKKSKEILTPF